MNPADERAYGALGAFIAFLIVAATFVLLALCFGCHYDPITPERRPFEPRPNPYFNTNPPKASIEMFRSMPAMMGPVTLPTVFTNPVAYPGWEYNTVVAPVTVVPHLVLTSTPPRLKWQAVPGLYRVLVLVGTNWVENSFTVVLRGPGWNSIGIEIAVPTNEQFKVVSP